MFGGVEMTSSGEDIECVIFPFDFLYDFVDGLQINVWVLVMKRCSLLNSLCDLLCGIGL